MTNDSLYNWTPEQREEFEKIQAETNEKLRHYYLYTNFVENNFDRFSIKRRILMRLIENGVKDGKIDTQVKMASRIKSNKSVYNNKVINKNLDDIFATTILTKTKEELKYIYKQIEANENISIVRKKRLNKANFVAVHIYLLFDNDKNIMECRFQTIEDFENSYSHTLYKANGDEELSEEQIKAIEENIQKLYNSGSAEIYTDIPLKWEAYYNEEIGRMYERQLTTNEILKQLYPFLELRQENKEK